MGHEKRNGNCRSMVESALAFITTEDDDKNEMVIFFWLLSMSGMTSVLCDESRERVL